MASVVDLANAIATFEGFYKPGTIAARNNNPGNLRAGIGQAGVDGGFAVFNAPADGWNALYHQINLDASRGYTLTDFMSKYAPSSENDTVAYTNFVSSVTGIDPNTYLTSLDSGNQSSFPTLPLRKRRTTPVVEVT